MENLGLDASVGKVLDALKLSSDPQHLCTMLNIAGSSWNHNTGSQEQEEYWAHWPASRVKSVCSKFSERQCLKNGVVT